MSYPDPAFLSIDDLRAIRKVLQDELDELSKNPPSHERYVSNADICKRTKRKESLKHALALIQRTETTEIPA